jgi:hypothetical protein
MMVALGSNLRSVKPIRGCVRSSQVPGADRGDGLYDRTYCTARPSRSAIANNWCLFTISSTAQSEAGSTGEATVAADAGEAEMADASTVYIHLHCQKLGTGGRAAVLWQLTRLRRQPEAGMGELLKAERHHGRSPNTVTRAAEQRAKRRKRHVVRRAGGTSSQHYGGGRCRATDVRGGAKHGANPTLDSGADLGGRRAPAEYLPPRLQPPKHRPPASAPCVQRNRLYAPAPVQQQSPPVQRPGAEGSPVEPRRLAPLPACCCPGTGNVVLAWCGVARDKHLLRG